MKDNYTCKAFTFSQYHGKNPPAGSTHIRIQQLFKYWPDFSLYRYGNNPDVLIFQKVYCTPDYQFPRHFKGIKILDLCDPDWMDGATLIKDTVDAVDAITCSSENLSKFIRQLTNKPVVTIPDRFDITLLPEPKKHESKATTVAWFGYRHNAELLHSAVDKIAEMGLNLLIISDDDPFAWQWLPKAKSEDFRKNHYTFLKYHEDTIYEQLQAANFCVLPNGSRPIDHFKSNNKRVKAILAGLPVATNLEELQAFVEPENRQKFITENYEAYKKEYDVKRSVEQYEALIENLSTNK